MSRTSLNGRTKGEWAPARCILERDPQPRSNKPYAIALSGQEPEDQGYADASIRELNVCCWCCASRSPVMADGNAMLKTR